MKKWLIGVEPGVKDESLERMEVSKAAHRTPLERKYLSPCKVVFSAVDIFFFKT